VDTILSVKDFSISFRQYDGTLKQRSLEVISALELDINAGEIAAVIGSSGSGKSLLAHALLGILPANATVSGEMRYRGELLTQRSIATLRGTEIALVPQSLTYLDPLMKVGKQVAGTRHDKELVEAVFTRYGLGLDVMHKYPFELSGGMARRILVAAAVIAGAKLIVADEPTPGLSETLALEALSHLRELADSGCAVMLITHDINLALRVADKIAIFYAGTTVETALRDDFAAIETLRHPYTKALWRALPRNGFTPHPGYQPYAGGEHGSCAFFPRCDIASEQCTGAIPPPRPLRGGKVRCCHAT
jgi:peptide/nickel transport system ATP-binding protein